MFGISIMPDVLTVKFKNNEHLFFVLLYHIRIKCSIYTSSGGYRDFGVRGRKHLWCPCFKIFFFKLFFVKILMLQSCALQQVMNHLSVSLHYWLYSKSACFSQKGRIVSFLHICALILFLLVPFFCLKPNKILKWLQLDSNPEPLSS